MTNKEMQTAALGRAMRKHYTIWNRQGKVATHAKFSDAMTILKYQNVDSDRDAVRMLRDASSIGAIKRGHLTIVACGI